jgi:antitoxin YefM
VISAIKQHAVVGESGKIEIHADLPQGTIVEVLVLVQEQDETEYLMSNPINRQHLLEALDNVECRENIVTFTVEEWNAKYSV